MILQAVIKLRDPVLSRNRLPGIWTQRSRYTRYIDSTSITTLLTLNYTNPTSSNPTSGHAPSKYKLNTFLITQMQNLTFFTILFNFSANAQFWMPTARNIQTPSLLPTEYSCKIGRQTVQLATFKSLTFRHTFLQTDPHLDILSRLQIRCRARGCQDPTQARIEGRRRW